MKPAVGTEPWITRRLLTWRKLGIVINQMRNGICLHTPCRKRHCYGHQGVGPELLEDIEETCRKDLAEAKEKRAAAQEENGNA